MGLRSLPFFKAKKGWQIAGGGLSSDGGGGGSLPIATSETLGGVRIGSGIMVGNDGTITSNDIDDNLVYGVIGNADIKIKKFEISQLQEATWFTLPSISSEVILPLFAVMSFVTPGTYVSGIAHVRNLQNTTYVQVSNIYSQAAYRNVVIYLFYIDKGE